MYHCLGEAHIHRSLGYHPRAGYWPSRARAEADLGLAYLMLGNEQAGLQWLHRVQARFQSSGTHDDLLQSLENELAYAEQAKKKSQAKALRQRIQELEAAG